MFATDVAEFNAWNDLLGDVMTVLIWDSEAANATSNNLRAGMERLNVQPYETIYITENALDLPEAIATRVGTIQLAGQFTGIFPDIFAQSAAQVAEILVDRKRGRDYGYIGEMYATMRGKTAVWGGSGVLIGRPGFLTSSPVVDRALSRQLAVTVLGRYFPTTEARFTKHQFSRRLLAAKNRDRRAHRLFQPLAFAMNTLVNRDHYDSIVRVPPKPISVSDHVDWLVRSAASLGDRSLLPLVHSDTLHCIVDYPKQHDAGSHENRAVNVAGVFRATAGARGKRLLLIDDILTSGSTVASAAQTLLDAGALTVGVLAIGFTQNRVHRLHETTLPCNKAGCDGVATLQLSRTSDAAFWGCSKYPQCTEMRYFKPGLEELNRLNQRDEIEIVPDIRF